VGERTVRRLAWGIGLSCVAMVVASIVLLLVDRSSLNLSQSADVGDLVPALTFATVGVLIASRRPENVIGWLLLTLATIAAVSALSTQIAIRGWVMGASAEPWAQWSAWLHNWVVNLALGLVAVVLMLFPTGTFLSRRWRWAAWIGEALWFVVVVASALQPGLIHLGSGIRYGSPLGIAVLRGFDQSPVWLLILILLVLGIASLFLRARRSTGDERQQIKWLGYAVGVPIGVAILAVAVSFVNVAVAGWMFAFGINVGLTVGLPAAIAVAVLRYGLYEIDVVINKTIVYFLLAAVITLIYVGIVVGIGALIGSRGSTGLSLVAAAVVAVAFQPLRERSRRLANRLVYGKRATPYEVLSAFAERMASTYSVDDVLPRTARMVAQGTGAVRADVWLRIGRDLRAAGSWPDAPRVERLPLAGGEAVEVPRATEIVPVRHQGELLGAVSLEKAPGDHVTPTEEKLLADVASQAGLVLRNVGLIEELRASRQRLVTAQDEERRRLERNIHDGAQQQLVALSVKANLARQITARDPAKTEEMLEQLQAEAQDALENLRDLARGIYPPLLADKGLAAALDSQARRSAIPVTVQGDGIGRFSQAIEAAVYFSVLEGLQNVSKYAGASQAVVRVSRVDDLLGFEVTDDGVGFDADRTTYGTGLQGIADRLAALDGTLEVRSELGRGTTLIGRVPVVGGDAGTPAG
jgi:signal transduction histidine kinase